jgi:competence protein ComEC
VESWLENDGDPVTQEVAAARGGFSGEGARVALMAGGHRLTLLRGKGGLEVLDAACGESALVILNRDTERRQGCAMLTPLDLRRLGALAIWPEPHGLRIQSASEVTGARLWTPR